MNNWESENSKVTIAVFAYNSEITIVETLNSILNQSYKNITVIINDDSSSDKTIKVARTWIDEHNEIDAIIYKNSTNLGLNKCFNNVIDIIDTEWVKVIAADDILLSNCIEYNMQFIKEKGISTALFSIHQVFKDTEDGRVIDPVDIDRVAYADYVFRKPAYKQYNEILRHDTPFTPTGFYNVEMLKKIGGTTECIKNLEDWPLRLNILRNDNKIYFMNKVTVLYRCSNSISNSSQMFVSTRFVQERCILKKQLVYPEIPKLDIVYWEGELVSKLQTWVVVKIFRNKNTRLTKSASHLLALLDLEKIRHKIKMKHVRDKYIAQNGVCYE